MFSLFSKHKMTEKSFRNICFTSFDEAEYPHVDQNGCTYVIVGRETCPDTKRLHLQGYAEFDKPKRMSTLKKAFPTMHIEERKGSQKQAIDYCKKDGDWHEEGVLKQQGKRSDLEDVASDIFKGNSLSDIAGAHPTQFIKYAKGIKELRASTFTDRPYDKPPVVTWIWGPAGTGKTRSAFEAHESVYIKDGTMWWDGYEQQEAIIIDDFDGKWPYRDLLRLLDRYPYQGQYKGGYIKINSPYIYITCEYSPSFFWRGNEFAQVHRRLSEIKHLGPTGATNVTDVTEVAGNTGQPLLIRSPAFIDLTKAYDDLVADH